MDFKNTIWIMRDDLPGSLEFVSERSRFFGL